MPENKIDDEIKNKSDDYHFMQEQIKDRPINRKKLIQRSVTTVLTAVVFGIIACVTFICLEPVIGNWINPKVEETNPIVLPEEEREMLPEEMLLREESEVAETSEEETTPGIGSAVTLVKPEISDYQLLYDKLGEVAAEAQKSLVQVTAVSSDIDWFNNPYESTNQSFGLLIADNGVEVLILTQRSAIEKAEKIVVTFQEGTKLTATEKLYDKNTGLVIIAVDYTQITVAMKEQYQYAKLGSSISGCKIGDVMIAMGSPLGNYDSVCYGMLTSKSSSINMVDANYALLTTDIYGSSKASGVLFNMRGQVIGIIDQNYNSIDMKNMISALGISELRPLIEKMSNGTLIAQAGLYITSVTEEAKTQYGVPEGAYITNTRMDSPAMMAGIRKGDVIVEVGEVVISDAQDYISAIRDYAPDEEVKITIMRENAGEYKEMEFDITLTELK